MQTQQTSRQEWHVHVARWRTSGLSRSAYCEQHGLKLHFLVYWIKRSPPQSTISPPLTPITISNMLAAAAKPWCIKIQSLNDGKLYQF